jgi:hypothetical protein
MRGIHAALIVAFACGAAVAAQAPAERIDFAEFQKLNAAGKVLVVDVPDPSSPTALDWTKPRAPVRCSSSSSSAPRT